MKTRVYKYGQRFYPQYKGWFFWHYIFESGYYETAVNFDDAQRAIEYLTKSGWQRWEEVVWESK